LKEFDSENKKEKFEEKNIFEGLKSIFEIFLSAAIFSL
jgi:hypothetical protein